MTFTAYDPYTPDPFVFLLTWLTLLCWLLNWPCVPPLAAWTAVISNGLVTAKIGLSTAWLPGSSLLLVPATLAAAWVLWHEWTRAMPLRAIAAND